MNNDLDNSIYNQDSFQISDSDLFYDDLRTGYIRELFPGEEIPDFISDSFRWGEGLSKYGFFSIHGTVAFIGDDRESLMMMLKTNNFNVLSVN